MAWYRQESGRTIIRLSAGESVLGTLQKTLTENAIEGGFFFGVGACKNIELAYFDPETKEFTTKKFAESHEMANISGTAAYFSDEILIHAHATFAGPDMSTIAGHLVSAEVSGTAEIILFQTDRINKKEDPETGLKVFDI